MSIREDIVAAVAPLLDQHLEQVRVVIDQALARASTAGDPDDLLPTEVAASMLGMTPSSLRRIHERGSLRITPVKIGKRGLRWRRGDIRALVAETQAHKAAGTNRRRATE